ncbi:hypothetical protein AB0H73_34555 [Streptomyces olivoreticuli]
MSPYRVQYAPGAGAGLKAMGPGLRNRFGRGMRALAADPCGNASRAAGGGQDRRQAVIGGAAIAVRYVSPGPGILMVTVVRVVCWQHGSALEARGRRAAPGPGAGGGTAVPRPCRGA